MNKDQKLSKLIKKIANNPLASFLVCFAILIGILVPVISISFAASYNGDGNGTGWWKATFSNTSYTWTPKKSNTTSTLYLSGHAVAHGDYGKEKSASKYTIWMAYFDELKYKNNGSVSGAYDRMLYASGTQYFKSSTKQGKLYKGGPKYSFSTSGTITFTRGTSAKSHTIYVGVRTNKDGLSARKVGTFTVPVKDYNVTYNANGGTGAPAKQLKPHGTAINLSSTVPTRSSYKFDSWNTNSSGTGTKYAKGAKFTANANTTLYAKWLRLYTISYDANGGTGAPGAQTKTQDVNLTISATVPTRTGYIFKSWNTKKDGTGTNYASGTTFKTNSNTTLYAQWLAVYTIKYNANGGTGAPADQTQTQNSSITLSNTIPTRTGYIFNGWNTKQNGTGTNYDKGSTFRATSDTTLYANWVKMPEKCDDWKGYTFSKTNFNNLGFNYGYACFNLAKNQSKYATTIVTVEPTSASNTNGTNDLFSELTNNQKSYTFTNSGNTDKVKVGESSTTEYTSGKTSIIGETSTNFAYLNPTIRIIAPRGYKYDSANSFVAYNNLLYEEATALWPYKENSGDSSNRGLMSTNPGPYSQDTVLNGYDNFHIASAGLVTRSSGTNSYVNYQSVNINFVPNKVTIKFDANGGEGEMDNQVYTYDSDLKLDENDFTKEESNFRGWTSDKDILLEDGTVIEAGELIENKSIISKTAFPTLSEVTLKAVWQDEIQFDVTFVSDSNGKITSGGNQKIFSEEKPNEVKEEPYPGYQTLGWRCNKDITLDDNNKIEKGKTFKGDYIQNIIITEDLKCTVLHAKEIYTVYYKNTEGLIWEKDQEDVEYGGSPTNTYELDKGFILEGFIADTDVILTDNKVIKEGDLIPKDSLGSIKVQGTLNITAKTEEKEITSIFKNPKTGDRIKTYIAVSLLTFLGVTFFTILREDRKERIK